MKVAILSLPLHANYGGILQSYALTQIIKRRGCSVQLISRPFRYYYSFHNILASLKRTFTTFLKGDGFSFLPERKWNKGAELIEKNTKVFFNKYIPIDPRAITQIRSTDYDAIIVGSDQVWRPYYFKAHESDVRNAFLMFAKNWNIKRMAYAASFGTDVWEYSESMTKDIKKLAQKFDYISVREKSGVDLCDKYLGVNAVHALDPTLLLHKEDYLSLINNSGYAESKTKMLVYVLDKNEEKQIFIEQIAKSKGLSPLYVGCADDLSKAAEERIQPPVEEWLAGFRDAEFVITDSFHACVFSILFNKPFVVVANHKRGGARFISLLGQFNLMDHLLERTSDYDPLKDYNIPEETYQLLDKFRHESMSIIDDFLKE
ncbi:MAG: polysaccharide pyruvyl transferase family protein [Bacteroidaceae bacterium]|nr:polysaccharide pyruvyl transferase family protein [Bacteroidaceae bacterium]